MTRLPSGQPATSRRARNSWPRRAFLGVAEVIRALPRIRGKVRLGLALYRWANPRNEDFVIETTLFRSRLRFTLHLTSAHERMAYLMGQYEEPTGELLAAMWTHGAIVDVGANIGLIALPTAKLMERAGVTVYALEALPSNFAALAQNVESNALRELVVPLPIALGSDDGAQVSIQIEGNDPGRTGTANILPERFQFEKIPLSLRTLDALVAEGTIPRDIGIIKIDTDGYDLEVLLGAEGVLREARPTVLAELSGHCMAWHGQKHHDVARFLATVGYELWVPRSYGSLDFVPYDPSTEPPLDCLALPLENRDAVLVRVAAYRRRRTG